MIIFAKQMHQNLYEKSLFLSQSEQYTVSLNVSHTAPTVDRKENCRTLKEKCAHPNLLITVEHAVINGFVRMK